MSVIKIKAGTGLHNFNIVLRPLLLYSYKAGVANGIAPDVMPQNIWGYSVY